MAFQRENGVLCADHVPLPDIAAAVGTPLYVYSWPAVRERHAALAEALAAVPHRICYAVKANSNLALLTRLRQLGAGFDIVSGGELTRVCRAGGDPAQVIFSGVGKSSAEMDLAIERGIGAFNVESAAELERLAARATHLGKRASVSVRVNVDVDAGGHPYIATGAATCKFGVPLAEAPRLYRAAAASPALTVVGIGCHIGSQIDAVEPFQKALAALLGLADALAADGVALEHLDIGGGFGVRYRDEAPLDIGAFGRMVKAALGDRPLTLLVEPGRYLVAEAGVLLTRVEYLKPGPGGRGFAVVDAAMNDLLRPTLYQAWHAVEAVTDNADAPQRWDVVGPVCESGDFLALDRTLGLRAGALLAVRGAGAYGFTLSSNYNSRCRAAEVLVDEGAYRIVRRRETVDDLLRLETP